MARRRRNPSLAERTRAFAATYDVKTPARRSTVAVTAVGVGVTGWLAVRYYIRSRVVEELTTKYHIDRTLLQLRSLSAIGLNVALPTVEEFARSLVPLWSPVMPQEAIEDILQYGRQSRYWPAAYRTGSVMAIIEPYLLAGFRDAYYGNKKASPNQVAATVISGFVSSALSGKR